jgi:hypothetical protein
VIVLSASFEHTLHAYALERGASAVLDKTEYLGQVAQAVRRLLAGARLQLSEQDLR